MKKLVEAFGKLIPKRFRKPILKQFLEDDYEMEEYHNPLLGIGFFNNKKENRGSETHPPFAH